MSLIFGAPRKPAAHNSHGSRPAPIDRRSDKPTIPGLAAALKNSLSEPEIAALVNMLQPGAPLPLVPNRTAPHPVKADPFKGYSINDVLDAAAKP